MIYRSLKLTIFSLVLTVGIFGGASFVSPQSVSAQAGGGTSLFLPFVTGGLQAQTVNTNTPFASPEVAEAQAQAEAFDKAIAEMEQNISISEGGQLEYDSLVPLSSDVTPDMQKRLLDALAETNRMLKSGELTLDELDSEEAAVEELAALAGCAGRNSKKRKWWGYEIKIDNCKTIALVGAISAGGGGVCLVVPPACTVAGPLAGIGAGTISAINAWGGFKGIKIKKPWVGPAIIWHQ